MRRKSILLTPLLAVVLLFGAFQNCSSSDLLFEDLAATALKNEFEYPYSSKPGHYLESALMLEKAPNPNMNFKVFVFVGTPSWSQNEGTVHVRVTNNNGQLLCPQETLSLSTGKKSWELSCVPPIQFSEATVRLTLNGTSGDFVKSKLYSLD